MQYTVTRRRKTVKRIPSTMYTCTVHKKLVAFSSLYWESARFCYCSLLISTILKWYLLTDEDTETISSYSLYNYLYTTNEILRCLDMYLSCLCLHFYWFGPRKIRSLLTFYSELCLLQLHLFALWPNTFIIHTDGQSWSLSRFCTDSEYIAKM